MASAVLGECAVASGRVKNRQVGGGDGCGGAHARSQLWRLGDQVAVGRPAAKRIECIIKASRRPAAVRSALAAPRWWHSCTDTPLPLCGPLRTFVECRSRETKGKMTRKATSLRGCERGAKRRSAGPRRSAGVASAKRRRARGAAAGG